MTTFAYTILAVKDLESARDFYREYFDQVVDVDMGKLIGFQSGLALWEQEDMAEKSGLGMHSPVLKGRGGLEVEFHTDDIEGLYNRLREAGVTILHEIKTHPWEQKVFRCLDFDGHCIEVDEYLRATALRLAEEGRPHAEIAILFGMSPDSVADLLKS